MPWGLNVLFIAAAACSWDAAAGCLADPAPGELFSPLPVLHLLPHETQQAAATDDDVTSSSSSSGSDGSSAGSMYSCPVYKTPARAGVLSSTGRSSKSFMHLRLPIPAGSAPSKWLLQGAACLASLDE
jgi:dynein heavy chain